MNYYVLYNNITGNIYFIKHITEAKAQSLCDKNANMHMSYMLESDVIGFVPEVKTAHLAIARKQSGKHTGKHCVTLIMLVLHKTLA